MTEKSIILGRPIHVRNAHSLLLAFLCAGLFALCILVSWPVAEIGMNDDWSYVWSARTLADSGKFAYVGWSTAMLGWQLYIGAIFIKLFGFSFTAVRGSAFCLSVLTAILLQRLYSRFDISVRNATWTALATVLSPVFLALAFSFMSDMGGCFCILLCIYLCIRAIDAGTNHAALGWLALAALSNVAGGTVRQIAWLGALVIVPSVAWLLRRRPGLLSGGLVLWGISAVSIIVLSDWFNRQPYSQKERLFAIPLDSQRLTWQIVGLGRTSFALIVLLLPVLLAFVIKYPGRKGRPRVIAFALASFLIIGSALEVVAFLRIHHHRSTHEITPFSNNLVTSRGLLDLPVALGERPDVVPLQIRILLISLTFTSAVVVAFFAWNTFRKRSLDSKITASAEELPDGAVFALLGPYTAAYLFLMVTRGQVYDRYLLPLLFVSFVVLMRLYERRVSERLPLLTLAAIALYAVFGVAGLHDLFAMERARLSAIASMQAAGIGREHIRGGFEYDAWTQLEQVGYINDPRIRIPIGAYHKASGDEYEGSCSFWFSESTPTVHGHYGISFEPDLCGPAPFAPVSYHTWLAPHEQFIYVRTLR